MSESPNKPELFFGEVNEAQGIDKIACKFEESCCGIRVFYFDGQRNCDHTEKHEDDWKDEPTDATDVNLGALEAGTIVAIPRFCGKRYGVIVVWDCGHDVYYREDELEKLRVFDLGPAGYKGEMMFCDKCLIPVMGFGWRLAKHSDAGDLYDLCCRHYNENEDPHSDDEFFCNIPSGDIDIETHRKRPKLKARSKSRKHNLIGLFKGARVNDLERGSFQDGRILKVSHHSGTDHDMAQEDMRKATTYNCFAEVVQSDSSKPLEYRSAGCRGILHLQVKKPGTWGLIFPDHHPCLSPQLLQEMTIYKSRMQKLDEKDNYCFMRYTKEREKKCYSLTISGTTYTDLNFSEMKRVWEKCENLRIVILLMNQLIDLPSELVKFEDTITLICIQNNCFKELPSDLYRYKKLEHLNMHGNLLFHIPDSFKSLSNLTRLYLGDNNLMCLPDVFGHFPHLKKASFTNNSLTRLPPSFAQLTQLVNLDISYNAMLKMPASLLGIKLLKFLDIRWNRLQRIAPPAHKNPDLSRSMQNFLMQLICMQLSGNPLWNHACALLEQEKPTDKEVLDGLRGDIMFEKLSKIRPSRSLLVNVVGNSGAGKTSVVEAFSQNKYVIPTTQKDHRHTVGIERHYMPVKVKSGRIIQLNIWDHAGDNEYAMMNDLFISERSLVWLVVDLSKYSTKDPDSFNDSVGKWLFQVLSHNEEPFVWIVGTHAHEDNSRDTECKLEDIGHKVDELCKKFVADEDDTRAMMGLVREKIEAEKQRKKAVKFLSEHKKIIAVTNTHSFLGLNEIKSYLEDLDSELLKEEELPIKWEDTMDRFHLLAENELNPFKTSKRPTITIKDMKENLKKEEISFSESEFNKKFLIYYHEIGEIFLIKRKSFADDDIVVLNVDWIIHVFKEIYRHDLEKYISDNQSDFSDIKRLILQGVSNSREEYGLVHESILKVLWRCKTDEKLFEGIIKLFKEFNLTCAKEDAELGGVSYFFPYLMKSRCPEPKYKDEECITIKFSFSYYFPKFFHQRLGLQMSNDDKVKDTKIFEDGFKASFNNGVDMLVHTSSEGTNAEGLVICAHTVRGSTSDLWKSINRIVTHSRDLLSNWVYHGKQWYAILCPNKKNCCCKSTKKRNHIELINLDKKLHSDHQGSKLICTYCKHETPMDRLIPPCDFFDNIETDIRPISSEKKFKSMLPTWKLKLMQEVVSRANEPLSTSSDISLASEAQSVGSYTSSDLFEQPIPCAADTQH